MARKDLLTFLFGESVELEAAEAQSRDLDIAKNLERLFEAAAEAEVGELKSKKTPLAKALSELGIADAADDLELDTDGFVLATDNHQRYMDAMTVLGSADAMHKLAEMGWVVTKPGDNAMTNEAPNYRIRFLEITTVEQNDREPKGGTYDTANREEVIKKAQEFASTPMDRDDDSLNPVENDIEGSDQDRKGIGKEKEGAQPEGTPKGTSGKAKLANVVEAELQEFTSTGSMGTAMSQGQPFVGMVKKPKPYGKGTKFNMPSQWKVKQPVVNQQVKRKVRSEAVDNIEDLELRDLGKTYGLGEQAIHHAIQMAKEGMSGGQWPNMRAAFRAFASAESQSARLKTKEPFATRNDESAEGTAQSFLKEEGPSDIPPGTFGNPGGPEEPSSGEDPEAASQEAYQDMRNDLETGECVVFDDSRSGPTRIMVNGKLFGTINDEEHARHSRPFQNAPQGVFKDVAHALRAVSAEMERTQFWPNIYHINDHGNVSLWDKNGKEIYAWV